MVSPACCEAPAALTGYNLILFPLHLAQRDGLNNAQLTDAAGQLLQGLRVKLPTGLVGVGFYLRYLHLVQVRRAFGLYLGTGVYQCVQATAQSDVIQAAT